MIRNCLAAMMLAAVALLSPGCAWFSKGTESPVVGKWTNPLGMVWTIKGDGTFEADITRDGTADASGRYVVDGDKITLWQTRGLTSKSCQDKGVYRFVRSEDSLRLTVVNDNCRLRRQNLRLVWRKK